MRIIKPTTSQMVNYRVATRPSFFLAVSFVAYRVTAAFGQPTSSRTIMTETTNWSSIDKPSKPEMKDAKFWDRFAEGYSKRAIADEESYQKKLQITREYFKPDSAVLEFGCGTGETALLHAPLVQHIHGIDFSSKMIEIAKEKATSHNVKNVDFETMGIDTLSVPDESYDIVLGLNVLHLVSNKDEVVSKVHSLLKPGGYFVSSSACIGDMGGVATSIFRCIGPVGNLFGLLPTVNAFSAK
jgi:SAM-dependent methyltransferase